MRSILVIVLAGAAIATPITIDGGTKEPKALVARAPPRIKLPKGLGKFFGKGSKSDTAHLTSPEGGSPHSPGRYTQSHEQASGESSARTGHEQQGEASRQPVLGDTWSLSSHGSGKTGSTSLGSSIESLNSDLLPPTDVHADIQGRLAASRARRLKAAKSSTGDEVTAKEGTKGKPAADDSSGTQTGPQRDAKGNTPGESAGEHQIQPGTSSHTDLSADEGSKPKKSWYDMTPE
ncbi:hypothetical protein CDD80_6712 [Ophiocordyceps camponoti-rufipedis]|uniref:Uncharacterized protein n=1 Tax=Ophiocordyceps camponoti-rufipedis TaxID=2004952 RepID=A0A2C5ZF67_9HYPO|nr:hypothetical protein CDD80_6712 [Ophiocordyceps camponoti-rufipedis]